jgi:20S proteasome alpha/beta subunit
MASGGSVVAVEYDGGVLMAADTLLAYGSMAKAPNVPRTRIISKHAAVAATGDYADFQEATRDLMDDVMEDQMLEDGVERSPKELFSKLHRTLYHMRSEFKPYLCSFIVIGHDGKKSFLAASDSIGTRWSDKYIATGYGAHIATPLLRRALEVRNGVLSRDEAMAVLTDCMRSLFYRECRAVNRFQFAEAANGKVVLHPPVVLDTQWELDGFRFETTAIIQ